MVALTFCDDEVIGLITTEEGNFNIGKDKVSGKHLMFNDKNMWERPNFTCGTVDYDDDFEPYDIDVLFQPSRVLQHVGADGPQQTSAAINKYVRLYFETEYDIYQTKGSISAVETYVTGVFNQVAILYQNEDILTKISQIYIWTYSDTYNATTTLGLLSQFQSNRSSFTGDLGQLLTFRDIGGGIAAGFNGLCNSSSGDKLSVAMIEPSYENVPIYSWTVMVVTHEFGHLFGSRHTHACVWNGNNTAIDRCAGYTESTVGNNYGNCSATVNYPSAGGTIMSYCHQASCGINFNLGFGAQPGNVIRNSVINASCLQTNSISGSSTICTTPATYTLSSGTASSWSVTPTSAFSLTSTYTASAIVKPLHLSGQAGTLTAIVNGVAVKKTFTACSVTINGEDTVCAANIVYSLSDGFIADSLWTITPDSCFNITTFAGLDSAYVTPVIPGQAGTLTAIVNGIPVTKLITSCSATISGQDTICANNATYTLTGGATADLWTVAGALRLVSDSTVSPAVVHATAYDGSAGSLTAWVGGVPVTKEIRFCHVIMNGQDTICTNTTNYSLSGIHESGLWGNHHFSFVTWNIEQLDTTFSYYCPPLTGRDGNIIGILGCPINSTSRTVRVSALSGDTATLVAILGGVAIRKDIVTCNVTISGPDTVCASGAVYTLPDNMSASSWTLLQGADSAFSLTFTPDSAVVTLSDFSGNAAATLVALVNGVEVRKELAGCEITISGPDTICPAAIYTLSAGSATWSVTPGNIFQLYSSTGNSVMVTIAPGSTLIGQAGTLTATVNGIALTKAFQVCTPYIVGLDTIPIDVCAATYTLAGVPDDSPATLQWKIFECGDNMSILIYYGSYSVFDKTTTDEQPCTEAVIVCALRMTINGQNQVFFVDEKIISIPETPPVTATPVVYPGTHLLNTSPVTSGPSGSYRLVAVTTSSGILNISPPAYRWIVTGPDGAMQILYGARATVTFMITGTYSISLSDSSSCWSTPGVSTTFTVLPTYSLYPNPVTTGILNIAPVSGSTASHTCLAYTIRTVATGAIVLQGQVSRSSGQRAPSQINVSSLSSGLYLVQLATCGTLLQPSTLIQTDVIVIP